MLGARNRGQGLHFLERLNSTVVKPATHAHDLPLSSGLAVPSAWASRRCLETLVEPLARVVAPAHRPCVTEERVRGTLVVEHVAPSGPPIRTPSRCSFSSLLFQVRDLHAAYATQS